MPYATINNHRLHYVDTKQLGEACDESTPPIVMIHGLGSSQNYYMPVIVGLKDCRCVALSTYGAAGSKSQGESLSMGDLVEDVVGLMDVLEIAKAVVVGHSMGGPMAYNIAAAYSDRVAGLVCIGPVSPAFVKPEIFRARIDTVLKEGMESLANTIPQAATSSQSTPLQRAMIRELLLNQEPNAYASHCRVIMEMKDPDLSAVQCPVLVLAGEEDKSAPLEGCEYILKHLGSPNKDLSLLKNVGHWHCIEAGDQVAQAIADFMSRV